MPDFKIIKPSVERIDEKDNLKRIELAGRVCYKSEKKITEGSARAFCDQILIALWQQNPQVPVSPLQ